MPTRELFWLRAYISHGLWTEAFGGDRGVVGRYIRAEAPVGLVMRNCGDDATVIRFSGSALRPHLLTTLKKGCQPSRVLPTPSPSHFDG